MLWRFGKRWAFLDVANEKLRESDVNWSRPPLLGNTWLARVGHTGRDRNRRLLDARYMAAFSDIFR